ncbi:MAG: hypothetical protein RLZ57_1137 [Actinomycetota bacterium]|jgi:hypothetical protein
MKRINRENRISAAFTLMILETSVLISIAIYLIYKNCTATNTSDSKALSAEIGAAIFGSIIFSILTLGIRKAKRYAFAPTFLFNLIFLGVSKYMVDESFWIGAIPLVATSLALLLLVGSLVNE